MLKVVVRGLIARRTRLILAAAAVAIGVSSVAGTLILADSVHHSYATLVRQVTAGIDVYVRGPEIDRLQGISDFAPVPDDLVAKVRAVPGTGQAQGQIVRVAQLVRTDGVFVHPGPTYAYSWPASRALSPFTLVAGRPPAGPGEVVLDRATASSSGLGVGAAVRVSISAKAFLPARVTGLVAPRLGGDLAGAAAVFVAGSWAQRVLGINDRWDLVEVAAVRGVSADVLRARIAPILPDDGTSAVTSRQYADAQVTNLTRRAGSVTAILLALSLLAVLVAAGVILGTFTILVTQRTRELALLRMMGMTGRQVHACVLAEAGFIGLVAAGLGATAGIPASFGLRALTSLTGNGVPVSAIRVNPIVLILVALSGAAVTVVIATGPARQAMGVGPLDGWRQPTEGPRRRRPREGATVIGLLLIGAAAVAGGMLGSANWRGALMTGGGTAMAAGVLATLPAFSDRVLNRLARLTDRAGAAAAVAAASARRHPRRTTAPAAALVLGLLMVTTVAVLAASAHASISDLVRRADRADLVVASDAAPGIDPETVVRIREAPVVAVAAEFGTDRFTLNGRDAILTAVDSDTASQVLRLPVVAGTLDNFADGDIAVTRSAAGSGRFHIGEFVAVRFGRPQLRYLQVTAVVADNGITRDWVIPFETYRLGYFSATIRTVFVKAQPGTTADELRRQVNAGVAGFPGIQVKDAAAYAQSEARKAEGPVALVQALVGLAVVIALLGVANTLSLSVVERSHELGVLRILGMTPGQLSLTVQWQALYIAMLGTGFGVAAGLTLGLSLAGAVSSHGINHLTVPAPSLAAVCVLVVLCTLIAAALPARRAAQLGNLAALPREV